jgi:hypothetical protein
MPVYRALLSASTMMKDLAAVKRILEKLSGAEVDPATLIGVYDKYQHELEAERPHKCFRALSGEGLRLPGEPFTPKGTTHFAKDIARGR